MTDPEQSIESGSEQLDPAVELDAIIARLPELQQSKEAVLATALELSGQHKLETGFYEDRLRNFFLVALSHRLTNARAAEHLSPQQKIAEEYLVNLAMPLLAMDKSENFENMKADIDSETVLPAWEAAAVIDKYTNRELTTELRGAIDSGLLSEVRQRMGDSQEEPYELRVLAIGDMYSFTGTEPKAPQEEYGYPPSEAWQRYDHEYAAYRQRLEDFGDKAAEFIKDMGLPSDAIPTAWVTKLDGVTYLCLPEPIADKVLHPEKFDSGAYDDDQKKRDLAALEHEYVHTQGSLILDGEPYFGIAFEERRAEYFSGDKMGYLDVKGFLLDMEVVTGFDFKAWLEKHKSGDRVEAYTDLANNLGVQAALELSLSVPRAYVSDSHRIQQRVSEYLGPPDHLLERIYSHKVAGGEEAEIQTRIAGLVEAWKGRGVDFGFIGDTRPGYLGLGFMTKKYIQAYEESLASSA